jgi:radical SAM superfamily enzyme YgiQ (UPF0313 family)
MRIVLINVPNTYELVGNDPVIIKDQQGVYPPLGLLYIASYLKNKGYDMHVLDCQAEGWNHPEVAQIAADLKPDLIGLTAMTFTLVDCKLVMQELRKRTSAPVVIGGPHTAIYPNECFNPNGLGADYVIVGEGEITLDTLAQDIANGKIDTTASIERRTYRQVSFIQDLNELPFPARELTNIDKYYSVLSEDTPTTTAFSSRGCPFSCAYCDRPALGKGFRAMNANRVADEMQWCQDNGIKEVFFYDDTFSVSMKRVNEICDEIKRRGIKIKWDVRTRVNVVNEALLKNMKEAGCERIHFGVETGNPRVVRELNKGTSIEQVEKAFDLCKRYKIKTLAYFMMGNPTETLDDVKDTLRLSKRIKPDFMQMTILSPFPATQIYLRALQEGVIVGDPWRDYANRINDDFRPPLWDQIYTRNELESHLRWFYGKFYLNPKFVFDRVLEVKNPGQFKRYASAGLSLLKMTLTPESKIRDSWGLRTKTGIASSAKPESAVELVN